MTNQDDPRRHTDNNDAATIQEEPSQYHGLDNASYTARLLRHASSHHLYLTSRRHFIGPIPEDWIYNHRKSWYRSRLNFKNYTSRNLTFSAKTTSFNEVPQLLTSPATEDQALQDGGADGRVPGNSTQRTNASNDGRAGENDVEVTTGAGATTRSGITSNTFVTARTSLPAEDRPTTEDRPTNNSTTNFNPLTDPNASRDQDANPGEIDTHLSIRRTSQVPSTIHSMIGIGSTTSLLPHQNEVETGSGQSTEALQPQEPEPDHVEENPSSNPQDRVRERIALLNFDDNVLNQQQRILSRIERTHDIISANRPRWNKENEGEMVRAQKMLVRVEETLQDIPPDYSENVSLRTQTREITKWREYVVVCRKSLDDNAHFILKMYKTRVIQDTEKSRKSAHYEIPLNKKSTRVNLYSSLDKTWALWHPHKDGTRIFILRPRSSVHAMEWYTFTSQTLGWHRPTSLLINVPDLNLSLVLKNPFEQANGRKEDSQKDPRHVLKETLPAYSIITNCMNELKGRKEWSQALEEWSKTSKMGLAWKRFDRLEWIQGSQEEQMYGSIAMQNSHDLELRPKYHYPLKTKMTDGKEEEEPAPIEGFLIRLTTQKGAHQRLGKSISKRQYYFTQDRFLCFCRPSKAIPPHPLSADIPETIPSYKEIAQKNPLQYDVVPFPIQDGQISWLTSGNAEFLRRHDEEAFSQFRRSIVNMQNAEGLVDLCQVKSVRASRSDNNPQNTSEDQNVTDTDHHDRFEIVLLNNLVIRLKAYNNKTRDEWVKRLNSLVNYWKNRVIADARELKAIRQHNLEILDIDERMESLFGQFASKWEVRRAQASPHLYNMCHMSGCRTIKMSSYLYRKPRRHSTFHRCQVICTAGQLLVFQDVLRKHNGVELPHTHKERVATLDLQDCYIYSGLLTENDLLYTNQTFDNNYPGHHALPRIYLSQDGWTSRDEDTSICFVIWHPIRKSLFRTAETKEGKTNRMLRRVSTLGVPGRTVVFKARSRLERDRWVLCIESEINRLQEEKGEDVRIV